MIFAHAIVSLAANFALRQVHKFGQEVKWDLVKADANVRIAQLVPGAMWDSAACEIADKTIDAAADFLKGDVLDRVVGHLVDGETAPAFEDLMAFVKEKVGI